MKTWTLLLLLFCATPALSEIVQLQDRFDANFITVNPDGTINVNVMSGGGGGGGTQYVDGVTQATPTGTVAMGKDSSNVLKALPLSASGNLNVNLAEGTITGGNAAASPTGDPVPASASYTGYNSAGDLVGVSTSNPLPVAQQGSVAVTGTFFQVTQPVSGPLTDAQLRATAVPVSGTFFQATQPVSGSLGRTWTLSSGTDSVAAAQSGTWTTGRTWSLDSSTDNVDVSNFPSTYAVTQSTSPWVVSGTVAATQSGAWSTGRTWSLSSGSDSVAAVQSGTWNINDISGTISLPTGAATAAKQDTGNTSLASIDTKITTNAQGIKTATAIQNFTVSGTGDAQDETPIASTEVTGYSTVYVEMKCTGGATDTATGAFEVSNDEVNWYGVPAVGVNFVLTPSDLVNLSFYLAQSGTCGDPKILKARIAAKYFRFNIEFMDVPGAVIDATARFSAIDSQDPITNTNTLLVDYFGGIIGNGTFNQTTMNGSLPVVIASDQSAIPVTGTFFQATQPVSLATLPALTAGSAIIGNVRIDQTTPGTTNGVQVNAALPAGTNNIGDVDVLTLPALPAGTNNIGDVDVLSLPSLPAGTNGIGKLTANTGVTIGAVEIAAAQTLATVTTVGTVTSVTAIANALPAGTNAIGKLAANSGVDIGDVDVLSIIPGTGATNQGKAEDAGHTTGDTGVAILGVRKDTATQVTSADAEYTMPSMDAYGATFVRADHPNRIRCTQTVSTATTIQALTGCGAPGAGLSIYVTDIRFSASAAGIGADAFPTLKYGTGGTCGTGTTVFWGALTAAAVLAQDNLSTPYKIPANNEICWISSTAGSKFVVVSGYIAP